MNTSLLIMRRHTVVGTFAAVLLVLSTLCQLSVATPILADGVQPMALLKGGTIVFGGGGGGVGGGGSGNSGGQYLSAFCMDINRDPPLPGNEFNNYSGKVELTFTGGGKKTYDLSVLQERSEAFKHFRIDGTGKSYALKFLQKDPLLQSIQLLSTVIAHTGDEEDYKKTRDEVGTVEEFAASLPAPKSSAQLERHEIDYSVAQNKIWYSPYRIKRVPGSSVRYEYKWRDEARTAIQQIINLDGRGDAILVRYADLNVLIYTGLSTAGFARIASKLPKNIRLQLILTHRDQDHIGNVTRLLKTADKAGVIIENVIMSSYEVPRFESRDQSTETVRRMLEELQNLKYDRNDLSAHLTTFTKNARVPIRTGNGQVTTLLREAKKDLDTGGPLSKLLSAEEKTRLAGSRDEEAITNEKAIATFGLVLSPDVKLNVFQKRDPKSPNESSLVTRITHNERSTLYTGDITEEVMDDLLAASADRRWTELEFEELEWVELQFTLSYIKEKHPSEFLLLTKSLNQATSVGAANRTLNDLTERLLAEDKTWYQGLDALTEPTFSLTANVMKWPHHAWLPKTEKGKGTLRKFILAVNPDTIVFSISPGTNYTKFSPADFADPNSFAIRLINSKDRLSRWLFGKIGDSTRKRLRSAALEGETDELKEALAQELTRVIQGPLIYSEELFAGVDLTGLSLHATLPDAERAHLNRELLERSYPREIGEMRGQHVEKVRNYLRKYLPDRHFNIVITARDGDAEFWTLNRNTLSR